MISGNLRAKCCAPQIPRQFGAGKHVVFTGDIVPKTLTLFLKRSTKEYLTQEGAR